MLAHLKCLFATEIGLMSETNQHRDQRITLSDKDLHMVSGNTKEYLQIHTNKF